MSIIAFTAGLALTATATLGSVTAFAFLCVGAVSRSTHPSSEDTCHFCSSDESHRRANGHAACSDCWRTRL